jgi:hypothetical protein
MLKQCAEWLVGHADRSPEGGVYLYRGWNGPNVSNFYPGLGQALSLNGLQTVTPAAVEAALGESCHWYGSVVQMVTNSVAEKRTNSDASYNGGLHYDYGGVTVTQ